MVIMEVIVIMEVMVIFTTIGSYMNLTDKRTQNSYGFKISKTKLR